MSFCINISDPYRIYRCVFFSVTEERAAISAGDVQGDWGSFTNERKLALYYKDTARTVTLVLKRARRDLKDMKK